MVDEIHEEKTVTVIYYGDDSLELQHALATFPLDDEGGVIMNDDFKMGKSIVAICSGKVEILNKTGESILPYDATS